MQIPGTKPQFQKPEQQPKLDPVYLDMAAAQMYAEGRWPKPQESTDVPASTDRR